MDNRFPAPGTDTQFPAPGTDTRFPSPGTDARFVAGGLDARFQATTPAAPSVINVSSGSILETAPVGTLIGYVGGDGFPLPTYTEVTDLDGKIEVVGNELRTTATFDYGVKTSHPFRLRAENSEGPHEQDFTLNVINVVAKPNTISLSTEEFEETALAGSIIATMSSDGEDPVSFSEVNDPSGLFTVDGTNLRLATAASGPGTHSLTLRATNAGGSVDQPFTITVTEASANDDKITSLVIDPEGWKATMTVTGAVDGGTFSGLNNPSTPGLQLTVTSKSWDDAGVETTVQRSVFATSVVRQPYPNGPLLQETEVTSDLEVVLSLSARIYAGDTVTAAAAASLHTDNGTGGSSSANSGGAIATVTNGSTEAYRKPQAVWLELEDQEVNSAAWAPKLCVYHRHAQQGRPVRAVKFIASDGTNTVESTITALSTSQYSASGLYANYFQPSWDLSSLTDGEYITVDAIIYPWVGDAFQISADGYAYPSQNISTLRAICNIGGTMYNKVYAYVDGVGAGGGIASTDPVAARANPCASIYLAGIRAKNENQTQNGWFNCSGVDIVLMSGVTVSDKISGVDDALDKLPVIIRGEDKTAVLQSPSSSASAKSLPERGHFKNMTIEKVSHVIMFRGQETKANLLTFEDCDFVLADGQSAYAALCYKYGRGQAVNCTGDWIGQLSFQSAFEHGCMLAAGNSYTSFIPYNQVSCKGTQAINASNYQLGQNDGAVFAWNEISRAGNSGNLIQLESAMGPMGCAIIGNVLETHTLVGSQTCFLAWGDNNTQTVHNFTEAMNTIMGQRTNFIYNDAGTVSIFKDGVSKLSLHWQFNIKSDYDISQPLIGNWAARHGVDTKVQAILDSAGVDHYGYSSWLGDPLGDTRDDNEGPAGHVFHPINPVVTDFANDQSSTGGGAGGGDYTPGASNTLPTIPAGQTEFAVDLQGRAIPTDGTALVGALQRAA
ncbi:hypothetical protein IWQ55_000291 [Labrenzia sp. EL_208]|nr:hypothetical protein [Labrenzia sp. EL_132]MBG6227099.1 hypothetical protein [Labrenzia sp. EL_208]